MGTKSSSLGENRFREDLRKRPEVEENLLSLKIHGHWSSWLPETASNVLINEERYRIRSRGERGICSMIKFRQEERLTRQCCGNEGEGCNRPWGIPYRNW